MNDRKSEKDKADWDQTVKEYLRRRDYGGAAQALSTAIQITPGKASLHCERANYLLWAGDHGAACQSFLYALRINPSYVPARFGLAAAQLKSGALLDALHTVSRVSFEDPDPASQPAIGDEHDYRRSDAVERFYAVAHQAFSEVQPPPLTSLHLKHSRLVPSREEMLTLMPQGGVCAEVGTQTGYFAKKIFEVLHPSKLHIYDIDFSAFGIDYFREHIESGIVELHEGDSSTLLSHAEDGLFDFIYIDGDHTYSGVAKDLEQARRKIKADGWLVCNDYTVYSPLEGVKYGVYRAVNELCLNHDFQIIYFGLHPWGYHDVALRKLSSIPDHDTGRKIWSQGLDSELSFWETVLAENEGRHIDEPKPLQDYLARNIDPDSGSDIDVLDIGSGPVSAVGTAHDSRQIHVTAVDFLADEYNRLIDRYSIQVAARPIPGDAEKLVEHFGYGRFDVIYYKNALDHMCSPGQAISGMIKVLKNGGFAYLIVLTKEAEYWCYEGLHQWNFDMYDDRAVLWNKKREIYFLDHFLTDGVTYTCDLVPGKVYTETRDFLHICIRKKS